MVVQKREPTLGWLRTSRRSFDPAGDRSLSNIKTQHEELAVDPRRSPGRVLSDHPEDQIPNLLGNSPPPCWLSDPGDQTPVETKACPMPSNHCLRLNYNQSFFPAGPELMGNYSEQFVEAAQNRSRVATLQYSQLLSEREVLQDKMPTATKKADEYYEPQQKQVVRRSEL
jgi:hypothetical protein